MNINKKLITTSLLATAIILPVSASISNADVKGVEYKIITANSVNFRKGPGTNFSSMGKLNKGYKVEYIGTSGDWINIKYNGKVGYAHKDYVSSVNNNSTDNSVKSKKIVTASSLNFRSGPSTSASKIGSIPNGAEVGVISESNGWSKVSYNGKIGYVSSSYLSEKSNAPTTDNSVKSKKIVTASSLNFRSGPSTSASKIGSIPNGAEVGVISESNGWSKVNYNGKIGYVSSSYLADKGSSNVSVSNKADKVIEFAKTLLGKPYVWGSEGPSSFDCSGYTQYVFKKSVGINLPRVSKDQAKFGKSVSKNDLQKGDLIAFDMEGANNGQVNHIGIYMGDKKIIHASSTKKKVLISDMTDYYYKSIVSIRRVL